nr:GTP-binding protein [Streptomyces sp. SCL15-4]
MRVLATAGHVDHGKSALVRALTGMEPDRHEEERRRGLTLDLGFVWTRLGGDHLAFVDVPGHERFVPTMLAGAAPCPPCCSWSPPTRAGSRSRRSTSPSSTRSASGTPSSR